MLAPAGGQAPDGLFFNPRTKCCTYVPSLPNFLVGRILLDRSPESAAGRATVEARIASGVAVTPAGLEQPPAFVLVYRNAHEAFGQSVSMRCPHYRPDTGACGIWRHRQAMCMTWFCKHTRGAVGLRFWSSLGRLLDAVERSLVAHCVLSLNPGVAALERMVTPRDDRKSLSAADVDRVKSNSYQKVWGRYAGREPEFYEACAELVGPFSWNDVVRVSGAEVQLAAALTRESFEALKSEDLPARLRATPIETVRLGPDETRVTGYSGWDPLVVPTALIDVLHHFDGRSTASALAAIAACGLELSRDVVQRLVDFEVLVHDEGNASKTPRQSRC